MMQCNVTHFHPCFGFSWTSSTSTEESHITHNAHVTCKQVFLLAAVAKYVIHFEIAGFFLFFFLVKFPIQTQPVSFRNQKEMFIFHSVFLSDTVPYKLSPL